MTGVDWDAIGVGDPDPTDPFDPDAYDDGCDATTGGVLPWWCTRDLGHDGPHVAGDGDTVAAVWT